MTYDTGAPGFVVSHIDFGLTTNLAPILSYVVGHKKGAAMKDPNKTPMSGLTVKEQLFSMTYVESGNATKAYQEAYNHNGNTSTAQKEGFTVLHRPLVQAAIAELQANHRKRHQINVDKIIADLEKARLLAMESRNPSAAVSASMAKAKLAGLLVDKTEIQGRAAVSFEMISPT